MNAYVNYNNTFARIPNTSNLSTITTPVDSDEDGAEIILVSPSA